MQTTKGIWICQGKGMKVLIMDVEGTDGREHGEDQVRDALTLICFFATWVLLYQPLQWTNNCVILHDASTHTIGL